MADPPARPPADPDDSGSFPAVDASADDSPESEDARHAAGEAKLVAMARQGDQAAYGELVNRYERRLLRVIGRFVRDREIARDLAQETFIKVYRQLDKFDASRRFGPWLFRIGVNLTLDYLRKQKRRGRRPLFSEVSKDRPIDPETADPRGELDLSEEVEAVLAKIPEKYRKVLILRDLENFPTSEIAAIEGRKEATIRWRLAEARNMFAEHWTSRSPA
ncbi:RNA polymerase sigma factor [Alienimonas sp. DA493]|uniref:RNA polymerase sigma factor n=1 Tax=Alienimonas sp. DA493 TaxID=3373605 RepID=UPI0037549940